MHDFDVQRQDSGLHILCRASLSLSCLATPDPDQAGACKRLTGESSSRLQGFSDYDSVGPQAQSISYDDDYDLTAQCLNLAHNSGLTNTSCKAWFEDNQGNCTSSEALLFPSPSGPLGRNGESLISHALSPSLPRKSAQTNRSSSTTTSPRTKLN